MSSIFRLSWQDLLKGLVISVLSSVGAVVITMLQDGTMNLSIVGVTALSSGLGYILKQLVTDENNKLGGIL